MKTKNKIAIHVTYLLSDCFISGSKGGIKIWAELRRKMAVLWYVTNYLKLMRSDVAYIPDAAHRAQVNSAFEIEFKKQ